MHEDNHSQNKQFWIQCGPTRDRTHDTVVVTSMTQLSVYAIAVPLTVRFISMTKSKDMYKVKLKYLSPTVFHDRCF